MTPEERYVISPLGMDALHLHWVTERGFLLFLAHNSVCISGAFANYPHI